MLPKQRIVIFAIKSNGKGGGEKNCTFSPLPLKSLKHVKRCYSKRKNRGEKSRDTVPKTRLKLKN